MRNHVNHAGDVAADAAVPELTPISERESPSRSEAVGEQGQDQSAEAVAPSFLRVVQPMNLAEAIRRGYPPEPTLIEIDLSKLSPEDRELLACRVHWDTGRDHPTVKSKREYNRSLKVPEPTPAGLLEAVYEDEAKRVEEERERLDSERESQAQIDEAIQRLRQASDEEVLEHWGLYEGGPSSSWLGVYGSEYDTVCKVMEERIQVLRARRAEEQAAEKAAGERRREEAKARAHAEAERKRARREAWIEEHGSDRLRRLLAEEIEHEKVYRDERLALERPGWGWDNTPGESDEPRNAPAAALDLLDQARESVPEDERKGVTLVHWTLDAVVNHLPREKEGRGSGGRWTVSSAVR